jgi:Protein of unknown function (DUF2452)
MMQAYNFLASWQLFPEKGSYEYGSRPKSGIYQLETAADKNKLLISMHWVTLENMAFRTTYDVITDGNEHPFENTAIGDTVKFNFIDSLRFETFFYKNNTQQLHILNELMPNGYMRVTQKINETDGKVLTNIEYYYKQLSVMPYAASASGAMVRATEEGVIRNKALTAMEEQTNMQLAQIRKQIELLALQAQEIQARKELSMIIYETKLSFQPVIGHTYYLYEKHDGAYLLSMISAKEWGGGAGPHKKFIAAVKLLADHTWIEQAMQ